MRSAPNVASPLLFEITAESISFAMIFDDVDLHFYSIRNRRPADKYLLILKLNCRHGSAKIGSSKYGETSNPKAIVKTADRTPSFDSSLSFRLLPTLSLRAWDDPIVAIQVISVTSDWTLGSGALEGIRGRRS